MLRAPAPTDQRQGTRPISFVLDDDGSLSAPVFLTIRPSELNRNEPQRATVHQTMGRDPIGWVDHFGEGLPSITISGHTGWRHAQGTGMDGVQSFMALNQMVAHDYPEAKQAAIDRGSDPANVRLIFVDVLDEFTWPVVPTQFSLRRSRSQPLLMQYSISLQAQATSVEMLSVEVPFFGTVSSGLAALDGVLGDFLGFVDKVGGWIANAVAFVDGSLQPVAAVVRQFVGVTNAVLGRVNDTIRAAGNLVTGTANQLIGVAADLARVGVNVFRTFNNITNLPAHLKAEIGRVASAYNEVLCIFSNSLRQSRIYEQYDGVYGASNCSSTTGGRQQSRYVGQNVFSLMTPGSPSISLSSDAMGSARNISQMDPVLAPMPIQEIGRNLGVINEGVSI